MFVGPPAVGQAEDRPCRPHECTSLALHFYPAGCQHAVMSGQSSVARSATQVFRARSLALIGPIVMWALDQQVYR